jgi:hypothetical protein
MSVAMESEPSRLLRQYLHKNADLGSFSWDQLNSVAACRLPGAWGQCELILPG